jgi:hypothetical protein
MEGDERARFCRECGLNVYNLSEMTRAEAESLVARTEGRLCARFYRRADGTVLTKDCPTGLRAARLRVSRAGVAAFAAVLSLLTVAQAKPAKKKKSCPVGAVKVQRVQAVNGHSTFSGVVADSNGGVIPGAAVALTDEGTGQKFSSTTSGTGEFIFPQLAAGNYTLDVSSPGFMRLTSEHLELRGDESVRVEASLAFAANGELIGVVSTDNAHDIEYENGKAVFSSKAVTSLPH